MSGVSFKSTGRCNGLTPGEMRQKPAHPNTGSFKRIRRRNVLARDKVDRGNRLVVLLEDSATNFVALMHIPAHVVETHCTAHVAFEREHVERAVWFGEGRFDRLIRPIAMHDLGNDGNFLGGRTQDIVAVSLAWAYG